MKKLGVIIALLILFGSCQWEKPQTPKHFIYGKWKSSLYNDIIFTFSENNILKVERIHGDKIVNETEHKFSIVDEKTVDVNDKTQPDFKVNVRIRQKDNIFIQLDCRIGKDKEGRIMTDPPEICYRTTFMRMNE